MVIFLTSRFGEISIHLFVRSLVDLKLRASLYHLLVLRIRLVLRGKSALSSSSKFSESTSGSLLPWEGREGK